MSIASCTAVPPKVCKTLMCRCSLCRRWIKVLADLRHVVGTFFYRHAGPTDLKRVPWRHGMRCGEPSFSCKSSFMSVGQDRPILTCSGSGDPELLRFILIQTTERSRGTGPRATVNRKFSLTRAPHPVNPGNLGNPASYFLREVFDKISERIFRIFRFSGACAAAASISRRASATRLRR